MDYPTEAQKSNPNFCAYYAKRTPMIPFHNGRGSYRILNEDGTITTVVRPCVGCRK